MVTVYWGARLTNTCKILETYLLTSKHPVCSLTTASSLSVLTSDSVAVEVSQTTVLAGLLHSLYILTELSVEQVCIFVVVLAILVVSLPIEEPSGEVELGRVRDDVDDLVDLISAQLTSSPGHVNLTGLADEVGETATNTLDGSQGIHDLLPTVDVGVANTQNVLEVRGLQSYRHPEID